MTNPNKTLIAVVLDESGSMGYLKEATLTGLRELMEEQKKQPGEVKFVVTKFSGTVDPPKYIQNVEELNYWPLGSTALYDGIGTTINRVGADLAALPEEDRPGKVIFVVQTDGDENSSRDFSSNDVQKMIEHQTTKYSWQFLFLGANQDAVLNGTALGFNPNLSITYGATAFNTSNVFASTNNLIGNYRNGRGIGYSTSDRVNAVVDDTVKISTTKVDLENNGN